MNLKLYTLLLTIGFFGFVLEANAQCEVGVLTTTGTVTLACDTDQFDLATDGAETVPDGGGFGWTFSTVLGGTGALNGDFILTGAPNPASYDADLNGLLSANNLPPFSGQWVVKAAVYSDAGDAFNTICATSMDSLIVDFQNMPSPVIDNLVDNGDGSATVTASGGMMPYTYEWSDGQTTETATGLSDGVYQVTVTDANGCTVSGEVAVGNAITCQTGAMVTNGTTLVCTADGTFDLETDGNEIIPAAGGFGWRFFDSSGGTGGLAGGFTLTGAANPATYDASLNGILPANNLPNLGGTWVMKAVVYDDASNPTATICSTSTDSLIVDFDGGLTVDVTDNGDGTATAMASGGMMPYTYAWSDGQTTETAVGLPDGVYTVTVTDANGCDGEGSVTIGTAPLDTCLTWVNPNPDGGWNDFNTQFGGAPCDDGTGCPFNEITAFEVFASEAYAVDNFQAGGTYTFSMCNGPGAGTWVPDFTIIAPSGAVDAAGPGNGDGCSITWTASETGTYLIVINELGECGGGNNLGTGSGFPALTCESGPEVECPEVPCEVGALDVDLDQIVCGPEDLFELGTDGMGIIPDAGGFGWQFSDASGGTGGLAGGFTLTNATDPSTYDTDLNGVLSSNNLDPLSGIWVVYGVVYSNANNAVGSICATTTDSVIVVFAEELITAAQDNGDGTATALTAGGTAPYTYEWSDGQTTQTAVNLMTDTYTVTITDALGCSNVESVDVVVSSVGEIDNLESLTLSPNPTKGMLNFQMQLDNQEEVRVEVRNLTGQLVQQMYFGNTSKIAHDFDLNTLAEGVYLMRIVAGSDEMTRRVMVVR